MREAGLVGKVTTLYRRTPGIEKFFLRHKNLKLKAPAPTCINQQWVADLTYIRVKSDWFYLAVVLDVFSRRVIGWSLGPGSISSEIRMRKSGCLSSIAKQ